MIQEELESLGITDYEVTTASLEAGSVTIRHHLRSHEDAVPAQPVLELGDWTGWLWDRAESESGGGERSVTLTYRDAVGYLDAIPIVLSVEDLVLGATESETRLVPVSRVLAACARAARAAGVTLVYGEIPGATLAVFAGGSGSVWSTVLDVVRWVPNVCSRCRGTTVELYVPPQDSGDAVAAVGGVDLSGVTAGTLQVGSTLVDIGALYAAWSRRTGWASHVGTIVANALVCCPEVATEVDGSALVLTAREPGAAGNEIVLAYTPAEVDAGSAAAVVAMHGGQDASGPAPAVSERVSWMGMTERSTRTSMDNLAPPVVAARGLYSFEIPAGASIYQPGAFVYQIPDDGDDGAAGDSTARQAEDQPWQTVVGKALPRDWRIASGDGSATDMREGSQLGAEWLKFWQGYAPCRLLAAMSPACLAFGTAMVEVVPGAEAFPASEEDLNGDTGGTVVTEDAQVPANYKEFSESDLDKLYVLTSGSFPASTNSRENVAGLRFCRARVRQLVWLAAPYSGTASPAEIEEFFAGTMQDKEGRKRHYTCLNLDCVIINRRRKRYQEGTNRLAPDDSDYNAEEAWADEVPRRADYYAALLAYYRATRVLGEPDRSVTLYGVEGYVPGETDLSVVMASLGWPYTAGRATWRAQGRVLQVSTARRSVLGVDDLLMRQQLGRRSHDAAAINQMLQVGADEESEEPWPQVSPSINVSTSAATNWRALEPFQMYTDEEGRHWIAGGVLPSPAGLIRFEDTDISEFWQPGRIYYVKAKWDRNERRYVPSIQYHTPT